MAPAKRKDIDLWTARFASSRTEAAYQSFVFKRNLTANIGGAALGLFLFIIYIFSDYIDAANPDEVAAIRIGIFALSVGLMSLLFVKDLRPFNNLIVTGVVTLMGVGNNLIIATQPTLDNTYYIAMIQGYILFSLLLRLSFLSMAFVILFAQACFMFAVFGKGDVSAAILQSANVFLVGLISVIGVYLLQRYQRADFLKSETIRVQNEKLSVLLEDAKRDTERKLAAMNMLVHFVKTPLHQINGFSDIVMNSLEGDDDRISISDGVEGARYIKNATANLSKSVNNLLTYHRLDDVEGDQQVERCEVDEMIEDFKDVLDTEINVETSGAAGSIATDETVLRTALSCLASHYNETAGPVTALEIRLSAEPGHAAAIIRDDAPVISEDDFQSQTRPLTKIDNYLTSDGSEMSMTLRTVARAVELCGGQFAHRPLEHGNEYTIMLRDLGGARKAGRAAA